MTTIDDVPAVMTVMEAARVLRVGRGSMYRLIAAGEVRSVRVGRSIRVPRVALVEFTEGRATRRA
jgi:excisionase family DNA binding protein